MYQNINGPARYQKGAKLLNIMASQKADSSSLRKYWLSVKREMIISMRERRMEARLIRQLLMATKAERMMLNMET